MCAENLSDRNSYDIGRYSGSARSAHSVGRVGALAVALGIGGAILGFTPVAAADNGPDSAGTGRSTDSANRRGGSDPGSETSETSATNSHRSNRAARSGRGSGAAESDPVVEPSQARDAEAPAAVTRAPAAAVDPEPAGTPDAAPVVIEELAPVAVAPVVGDEPTGDSSVPVAEVLAPVEIAAPDTEVPVMTAADPGALAEGEVDPTALLGEGGTGEPGAEPLAWAALAVTRREDLAGPTPELAPAATENTAAGADPAAAVGARVIAISAVSPGEATVGTTITITGSGFTGTGVTPYNVNSVTFGCQSSSCPGTAVKTTPVPGFSNTQLTVVVPAGAPTGYIQVNTASGVGSPSPAYSPTVFTVTGSPTITSVSPGSGLVGDSIAIAGSNLESATAVKFGCNAKCTNGVAAATFTVDPTGDQITASVPSGATSGFIQVTTATGSVISTSSFTVNSPSITSFTPTSGDAGTVVTISGSYFNNASAVAFNGVSAASFDVASSGNQITATAPQGVTDGYITVTTPSGAVTSSQEFLVGNFQPLPPVPTCTTGNCSILAGVQTLVVNQLAQAVANALPSTGPALTCNANGCPIPEGETTASVADTIGMYAFNLVYLLSGENGRPSQPTAGAIGQSLVDLVTQPNLLTFISETVAGSEALAKVPPQVGTLVGNAVASFVENSVGNLAVATALVPFLVTLNIPTNVFDGASFALELQTNPQAALLSVFTSPATNPQKAQQALLSFFQNPTVQQDLGQALADTVDELLGLAQPNWPGAPEVPNTALSDYLGEVVASKLLRVSVDPTNSLAITVGNTIQNLFIDIGAVVGADMGEALAVLLNQPAMDGQSAVAATLADFVVNAYVGFLRGQSTTPPLPFPNDPPLLQALAPGAGVAVTGFVSSLLTNPVVTQGLGEFITELVPGILDDTGIQDEIDTTVSDALAILIGGDLGPAVGADVADTVVSLLSDPTISGALTTFIDTAVGDFLNSNGVVTALADAAGALATAQLAGTIAEVKPQVEQQLRDSSDIQTGVDVGVTAATAGLLGNVAMWADVDRALTALVGTLLGDVAVQEALAADVAAMVEKSYPGAVGEFLGAQLGAVAVSLATNPVVEAGLRDVVDTLSIDFWTSPGVVTAFSEAAGELAAAAVAGDLDEVAPEVASALQTNPDIQVAVETSLGAATAEFFGDTALWAAVDQTLSAEVISLTTDPVVLGALDEAVQAAVEDALGEPLGGVVGPQVGAAVVSLVSNPIVSSALLGVVDTLFSDFFTAPGVVDAFSSAASQWGLVLLTTLNLSAAKKAAEDELKASPAIANGVDVSVTAAVAEFLGDTQLWATVDQTVSTLAVTLLGDVEVQDALAAQVSAMVAAKIPGSLGTVVGDAVGAAVVSLVTNPIISGELIALVDTLFTDFWGTPGVVTAFSEAAGELAEAALVGDLDTVGPEVQAALRANPDVQTAAEVAVGDAVTQLLSDTAVWTTVDATLSALVSGLLADPEVDAAMYQTVSELVAVAVGGPLGEEVGPQVAAAVVSLVTNPVVGSALHGVVDTLFSDFFGTYGVIPAFAGAASELALVLVTGGDLTEAVKAAQQELKASPAVENGVDASVTAAVAELLGDTQLWAVVDQTVSSLVSTLLGDTLVQQALGQQVSAMVAAKIPGSLGTVVGDAVGVAVVSLVTNPVIQSAAHEFVDTLFTDFWGTPGVVTAFSEAAGTLATAALEGDLDTVAPEVQAALRTDPAVDAAVMVSVSAAVTQLLSDTAVWATVDATLTALVDGLVNNPDVDQALYVTVSTTVATLVGEPLGAVVGPQVATAVVSLVTNPVLGAALHGVVDTLFSDFFGAPGVVDAFATAAGDFAEILVTGGSVKEAEEAARQELKASPAVENGVDVSVTAAVAELLGDTELWAVVDQTVSSLVVTLIGDPQVQQALSAQVAAEVEKKIPGPLGPVVGEAVGAAVVSLVTNPAIQAGIGAVVDTLFSDFWGAPGVVTAFSEAAGTLAMASLTGDLDTVAPEVRAALQANPDVEAAVDGSVTAAVAGLLSDQALWAALDSTLSALVSGLLNNPDLDQALYQTVSSAVEVLVGEPLGAVVGPQVATAVVSLVTDPAIEAGLHAVVDTLFSDFFGAPGVIDAFAGAAGDLALVAFTGGDLAAALKEVEQQLRTDPVVDAGVADAVSAGVSQLLSDTAVWAALNTTLSSLVSGLINDPTIDQALYQTVSSTVEVLVGEPLGAVVGPQVATAVVSLVTDPAIAGGLHALVDTLFSDFFGAPGVITTLSDAAGTLASAAVYGNLDMVRPYVIQEVRTDADIDAAVYGAVSAGVSQLLSDTAVWSALDSTFSTLISGLISDPVVQQALDDGISSTVSALVGGGPLGAVVGPQVAEAVMSLITDPAIGDALHEMVDTLFSDFFGAPGVISTLSEAAGTLATAAVYGNLATVAPQVQDAVRNSPDIDGGVDFAVSTALTELLADTDVVQAVGDTVTTLVTNLLGDTVVQQAAGAAVASLVTGYLGDSPIAEPVGQAIGVAVQQFLATEGVAADLGAIIGSVMPDFLGQPGVPDGLGSAAGTAAVALVQGETSTEATQAALAELKANPEMLAGVEATIADALNLVDTTMLSNPVIQESLGAITTNLIASLVENAEIQAYVAEQFGAPVADLLANQAVVDEISSQLGLAVTDLLAYPGVSTAITDSLNLFADEVITGTNEFVALGDALKYLQSDPAFVAGVNVVIPNTVNTILADPAVFEAIGVLVDEEVIAALQSFGIKIKFIDDIVGQVAKGTTESFLSRPAGIGVVDDLAVNLVLGMPFSSVASFLGKEVVHSRQVRYALSFSIGQGFGSLFGDNIVGRLVAVAVGVPVAVTLDITTAIERFYEWLSSGWAVAPDVNPGSAAALPGGSHYFQPVPAATDLYVMNAVLLDRRNARAAREALAGDGRLTLTGYTVSDPEDGQAGSLDITMSVDAADQQDGQTPLALLAFRFPLDRLVPAAESTTFPIAESVSVERVS